MAVLGRTAVGVSLINGEGTILVGDGSGLLQELPIGAASTVLTSDGTTASWQPAGAGSITFQDEGGAVAGAPHSTVNFTGPGVTASDAGGGVLTVNVPGGGSGVSIEDGGVAVAGGPFSTLNFINTASITDAGSGQADIDVGVGGGGAPVGASYVTITTDATLTDERTLAAGAGMTLIDGGANSSVTMAVDINGATPVVANDNADEILIWDDSAAAIRKQTRSDFLAGLGSGVTDASYVIIGGGTGDGSLTEERTLVGTANEVALTDGGANGNVEVGLADDAVLPGTGAVTVPTGGTAAQPGAPVDGMVRYNSDTNQFEFRQNGSWVGLGSGGGVTRYEVFLDAGADIDTRVGAGGTIIPGGWTVDDGASAGEAQLSTSANDLIIVHGLATAPASVLLFERVTAGPTIVQGEASVDITSSADLESNTALNAIKIQDFIGKTNTARPYRIVLLF